MAYGLVRKSRCRDSIQLMTVHEGGAVEIKFLGAAGTVTGSKFLVSYSKTRILVDCGLFQGYKQLRLKNWEPLPVDVTKINAVVLTHAHIDHSGYIPLLVRNGFTGPIYCTAPTLDLCRILLPDAARLSEEDAEYANRKGYSKHKPAQPLYTVEDVDKALRYFKRVRMNDDFHVGDLTMRFSSAGHILGAASVLIKSKKTSVVFSGDLGRYHDLIMNPPDPIPEANYIVMESTYGDRNHEKADAYKLLSDIINDVVQKNGILLIPSFAVGRAQTLLYVINQIFERGLTPTIPVYLNSPMATQATTVYRNYVGWHKLDADECAKTCANARFVSSMEESKSLSAVRKGPMIIISASGMLTGGRVLHHLRALAPDPNNTILLAGYQAPGTRGDTLAAGGKVLKMFGEQIPVAATVKQVDIFSAHADQRDLIHWLQTAPRSPKKVFLVHGEAKSADELRKKIEEKLRLPVEIPLYSEKIKLL